jgi:hypothetical protein
MNDYSTTWNTHSSIGNPGVKINGSLYATRHKCLDEVPEVEAIKDGLSFPREFGWQSKLLK